MKTLTLPNINRLPNPHSRLGLSCTSPTSVGEGEARLEKGCRLCRKDRRGTAVVEFAIVAPVFFLLVFGMLEFGRMVMVQQIITNASREGARVAVLDGAVRVGSEESPGVIDGIQRYLEGAHINPNSATITIDPHDPSSTGYGEPVTVTVTIPFDQVSWLPSPFFLGETNLSATSVMRRETVQ